MGIKKDKIPNDWHVQKIKLQVEVDFQCYKCTQALPHQGPSQFEKHHRPQTSLRVGGKKKKKSERLRQKWNRKKTKFPTKTNDCRVLTVQTKLRSGVNHTIHGVLEGDLLPCTNMMINIITAKKKRKHSQKEQQHCTKHSVPILIFIDFGKLSIRPKEITQRSIID